MRFDERCLQFEYHLYHACLILEPHAFLKAKFTTDNCFSMYLLNFVAGSEKQMSTDLMKSVKAPPQSLVPSPDISTIQLTASSLSASVKAKNMSSKQLCDWLKTKKIPEKYIKMFEDSDIDGELLAMFGETELEEMGIGESHIRKIILVQFSRI